MKTQTIFTWLLTLFACIAAATNSIAQQQSNAKPPNQVVNQNFSAQQAADYSFHVFMAPNKTYGYDIFNKGKVIYHQPAFSKMPAVDNIMLTKKEQANTAAMLAIDKIRKGENPQLTNDELKSITAH